MNNYDIKAELEGLNAAYAALEGLTYNVPTVGDRSALTLAMIVITERLEKLNEWLKEWENI